MSLLVKLTFQQVHKRSGQRRHFESEFWRMYVGARYLLAVLFGCVPVFWQLGEQHPTQRPVRELPDVDWDACSLNVTAASMPTLHQTLSQVAPAQVCSPGGCVQAPLQHVMTRPAYARVHAPPPVVTDLRTCGAGLPNTAGQ